MNIGPFADAAWGDAVTRCPKRMTHGPCAGVRDDGACEVPGHGPCSFLDALAAWPYPATTTSPAISAAAVPAGPAATAFLATAARRPVVVIDLPAAPLSADGLRAAAVELAGVADACLIGDHGGARVQFPPSYRARLLTDAGVPVWAGIHGRDRNRVALEGEIAACVDAGVTGLHCITGDHPALGHRPEAAPVFDLDSLDIVRVARSQGALCSVAHAPAAPPTDRRLSRLLAKVNAGADVVFVDHCGGPGPVARAVADLRGAGFGGLVLACVPVVTSAATAAVVASFAGGRLAPGFLAGIVGAGIVGAGIVGAGIVGAGIVGAGTVGAGDPLTAGIAATAELAEAMLAIPGVDGVNLSGGAPDGHELAAARAVAEVGRRVLGVPAGSVPAGSVPAGGEPAP